MKRTFKCTLSVLLAVIMVLSSLPFTAISAFAAEDMSAELQTAISEYEEAMTTMTTENKLYKNLTAAYNSYVKANRYVDAYKYGGKEITAAEFTALTSELRTNTAAMTEWTAQKGEYKQGFSSGDTAPSVTANNSINILYTTQTTGQTGGTSTGGSVERKLYYSSAVLLYDGVTKPRMPIMMSAKNNSNNKTRYIYAAYPVSSDVTNPRTMQAAVDHEDIILIGGWRGGEGTTLDWGWNYQKAGSPTAYTAGAGFAGLDGGVNGVQSTEARSKALPKGLWPNYGSLVMFSNALELTDSFAFNDGEYYRNISANWYVSSSDTPNSAQDSGIIVPTATITVLNYKALTDALKGDKRNFLADFKSYKQGGLKSVCSAFDKATAIDISNTTVDTVQEKANNIKNCVETINDLATPVKDNSGYAALRTSLDETLKTYEAGNTNECNYTAATWSPFETAVLNAKNIMSNLYSTEYSLTDTSAATAATTIDNAYKALELNKTPVDTSDLDIIMYNAHVIAKNSNFFTTQSMTDSNIVALTRQAKIDIWGEEENYPLEAQKIVDSQEARNKVEFYRIALSDAIRASVLNVDSNIAQIGYSLVSAIAKGQSYEATKDDYGNYAVLDEAVKRGIAFRDGDYSIDPEVENSALNIITNYAQTTNSIIKAVNGLRPSFAKITNGTIASQGIEATTKIDSSRDSGTWTLTWKRSDQTIFFKTQREACVFELPVSNMEFYNNCKFDAMIDSITLNAPADVATGELSSKYSVGSGGTADPYGGIAQYPGNIAITSGNVELRLAGIKATSTSGSAVAKDMAGNDITDINTDLTSLVETTEGAIPIAGGILAKKGTTSLACKTTITVPATTGSISATALPSAKSWVFDNSKSGLTMGMFYYWKWAPTGASPYYAGWSFDKSKYSETVYIVDISTLLDLIKECEALTENSNNYSTNSWNTFIGALSGAKAEMEYSGMTYAEIVGECDTRYTNLWNARKALVEPASNKELSAALEAAKSAYQNDESIVRSNTWNAFKTAYQAAMSAYMGKYSDTNIRDYDKTDATVIAEINELVTNLVNAQNALVYRIDFTADEFNVDAAVTNMVARIQDNVYTASSLRNLANQISALTYYNMSAVERATHYMDEADVIAAIKAEIVTINGLFDTLVVGDMDTGALDAAKVTGTKKFADPDAYDQKVIQEKLDALSAYEAVEGIYPSRVIQGLKYNTQEEVDAAVADALSNITVQKYNVTLDGQDYGTFDYGEKITVKSPTNGEVDWYYASASITSTTAKKYFTTAPEVTFIVKGDTELTTKQSTSTQTVKVSYVNAINNRTAEVQFVEPGATIQLSIANAPRIPYYTCTGITINGVDMTSAAEYVVNENTIVYYQYTRVPDQNKYSVYVADLAYQFPEGNLLINDLQYNDVVSFTRENYLDYELIYTVNNVEYTYADGGRAITDGSPEVYAWVEVNADDIANWRNLASSGGILNGNHVFTSNASLTQGTVVGYGTDFTFCVHKNMTLLALDKDTFDIAVRDGYIVDKGDDNGARIETDSHLVITEGAKISMVSKYTLPDDCQMIETGILFAANKNGPEAPDGSLLKLSNAGTNGIVRCKSTSHTSANQFVCSTNTSKLAGRTVGEIGMVWVAYMTYVDKDGNTVTLYTDPTSPSNTTDNF